MTLGIVVFNSSLGFLTKMELIMPTLKVLVKLREGCCKGVWVPDTVAIVSRGTKSRESTGSVPGLWLSPILSPSFSYTPPTPGSLLIPRPSHKGGGQRQVPIWDQT